MSRCAWPIASNAENIAILADPQIVDAFSYPKRNRFFFWVTRLIADRYQARSFRQLHSKLKPDAVFFLGDLFDGGREWNDKVWYDELSRFKKIFADSPKTPHYFSLPGNHDVGSVDEIIPSSFDRFRRVFGDANKVVTIGDYSLVTLDTNALMNQKVSTVHEPVSKFYEDLKANRGMYGPMIVMSHIPLYRPDGAYCGFEREGIPFRWVRGPQYVTEVNPVLSQDIFVKLHPTLVFSGDDHDACKYKHQWSSLDATEEYTVKAFGMTNGIRHPAFQMLSLGARSNVATESCLLGDPFFPLIFQGVTLTCLVLLILLHGFWNTHRAGYDRLGDSEKGITRLARRITRRLPREDARRLIVATLSWVFAQLVVNWWSYSNL